MQETVEDLEEQLQEALAKIENIAAQVAEKDLDAYEGFMQTETYKDKIVEIGHKLKERGVDITTLTE
ncbi:MAG: hypothetical protein OQK48_08995 [Sulfurimonas sp.]|uniref:hypothetical protein n=1 Tax=Sulfurimonas sp. TaxID=2022749 RepID=UPI002639F1AB|nr:hypothetical protein [Sulfurimonas sp.]MCW8894617.1 hypothetical protein [Sulfurimonas sp.]MCW8955060.1 hypothetical protein [Sulfurimonas sp.]